MLLYFAGLARKEEFHLITYYCPHCHFLNGQPQMLETSKSTPVANVIEEESLLPLMSDASSNISGSDKAPLDKVKDPKSE